MRANSGSVITTLCALAGVVALCMTTFGNTNIGLTSFNLLLQQKAACRTFLPPERFPRLQSGKASSLRTGEHRMTSKGSNFGLKGQVEINVYLISFFLFVLFLNTFWWETSSTCMMSKNCLIETKCCHCVLCVLFLQKNLKGCSDAPICQPKCYTMQTFFYCLQMSKTYSSWVSNNGRKWLIVQWTMQHSGWTDKCQSSFQLCCTQLNRKKNTSVYMWSTKHSAFCDWPFIIKVLSLAALVTHDRLT